MQRFLLIAFTITLLIPYYAHAGMTQEQCEYCLQKAKESVSASTNDCIHYINRTDISWIRKELYYGDNCRAPNFHKYFEELYPTWQTDCNSLYSGDLSYTRLIQNVWNNNRPIGVNRHKELCAKAQKQSRDNPQLLEKEIKTYIQEQASIGERLESKVLKSSKLRGEGDYASTSMALSNFQKILSKYGLTRGQEYDFSLCQSGKIESATVWYCQALKNNLQICAVCDEIIKDSDSIPTFANCDLSYAAQKYSTPISDCQL